MKLAELARLLDTTCHGDADLEITGVEGIEKAGPGQLTFVSNPKYTPFARKTKAAAVLVTEDFPPIEAATLRTAEPVPCLCPCRRHLPSLPRNTPRGSTQPR